MSLTAIRKLILQGNFIHQANAGAGEYQLLQPYVSTDDDEGSPLNHNSVLAKSSALNSRTCDCRLNSTKLPLIALADSD